MNQISGKSYFHQVGELHIMKKILEFTMSQRWDLDI